MNNIDHTLYCDYPIDYQQYYDLLFLSAFLLIFFFLFFLYKVVSKTKKMSLSSQRVLTGTQRVQIVVSDHDKWFANIKLHLFSGVKFVQFTPKVIFWNKGLTPFIVRIMLLCVTIHYHCGEPSVASKWSSHEKLTYKLTGVFVKCDLLLYLLCSFVQTCAASGKAKLATKTMIVSLFLFMSGFLHVAAG